MRRTRFDRRRESLDIALRAALVAFAASACSPHPPSSATTSAEAPQRIVALTAGSVDTLARLGELARVVAVEEDCFIAGTEQLTKIRNDDHSGPSKALNVEAVLALRPDLVIAKEDLRPALSERGVNVFFVPPATDQDAIASNVLHIGALLRVPEKARALVDAMNAQADAIRARVAGRPKVRVYFEAGRPGRTAGRGTVIDDMIAFAGGVNIAGEFALANPVLSSEAIVQADPEVILLSPWGESPAEVARRAGWERIAAVRNGRVHQLSERERELQYPSPSCLDGCERLLVPWLHPEIVPASAR